MELERTLPLGAEDQVDIKEKLEQAFNTYIRGVKSLNLVDKLLLGARQETGEACIVCVFDKDTNLSDYEDPRYSTLVRFSDAFLETTSAIISMYITYASPSDLPKIEHACQGLKIEYGFMSLQENDHPQSV